MSTIIINDSTVLFQAVESMRIEDAPVGPSACIFVLRTVSGAEHTKRYDTREHAQAMIDAIVMNVAIHDAL